MGTVVFFCIPAWGHTNPTLGVARELVRRGHRVVYYSYELLRKSIEAAGAEFVSCDAYDAEQKLTPADGARVAKDLGFSTKVLVDTTLALDGPVCRDMERLRPDCIVADSMAVWGKAVAKKLGIPFVSSTTTFAFNAHSSKIMPKGFGEFIRLLFAMPQVRREIKRLQKRGYPIGSVLDILQNDNDTHTIVYTSPEFQPCSETFSEKYAFVGPSLRPIEQPMEKGPKKLVYFSMGSVNNALLPLYRDAIQALSKLGCRVIFSVGEQVAVEDALPEGVEVYPKVDQMAVLACADVFVTHAGMNSVSEALSYGVPLVLLPQTTEQMGVANRVLQLGAGIRPEKQTGAEIAKAVRSLLADDTCRKNAAQIAAGFRACAGAVGAADKIEAVMEDAGWN